jgi:hypothetical protein
VDIFESVTLDPEVHTLTWPNGADFEFPPSLQTEETTMIARVLVTAGAALLGLYALWDDVLGSGVFLGIMFLLVAGLIWFGWEPLREGFWSAKNESEIPISRLGITIIRGMKPSARRRRSGPN